MDSRRALCISISCRVSNAVKDGHNREICLRTIAYLVSTDARYITGQTLNVDGGGTATTVF
ncbi:NAD(P)-dependent dehydrogenase (short-subunit alcohol dehydrogenase family) [Pseudarthrobacter sp. SLBN-100]